MVYKPSVGAVYCPEDWVKREEAVDSREVRSGSRIQLRMAVFSVDGGCG